MDKMKIVGTRGVSFTDDSGRLVEGCSFFFLMNDDRVTGQMAGKLFLSRQKMDGMEYTPSPGDDVYVDYDRYGKPSRFQKVK